MWKSRVQYICPWLHPIMWNKIITINPIQIRTSLPAQWLLTLGADEMGKVKVLVAQSCPTLCNPMNCSPAGSSVHGIHEARILEWVATSFSRGFSQPRDRTWVSCRAGEFFTTWATREAQNERHFEWRKHRDWGLQSVSNQHLLPHLDHSREISMEEDDDNQGKEHQTPLSTEPCYVAATSWCPRVVMWQGVTHCPSGLRVTVGYRAAVMAEQPSRGTADPGAFQARASCSPWAKETKLRRATVSGCSRHRAKHKDGRSPVRSPRKGRGGGVTHWSLEPSGWRWKQGPLQLQKGRKRPGISGCREPETAGPHGVSLVSMDGKSTHQTPPSGSFCSIIHTAFSFGDSCKGEAQGPGLENQGSLPHMPPWSPNIGAEPLPPLWGTTDGLPATPSARRGSLRARTQWEPTVRPRPGHDPEAGTHPAMRGVKHYCLRPISRDTPDQTKPKDPTWNKVKQNKSNSTASPNLTRLY